MTADADGRAISDRDLGSSMTEFPARLGKVAPRALALHGYTRYDQLTGVSARELLRIHGVGPKAIRILTEELAARGLALAPSQPIAVGPARDRPGH